MKYCCWGYDWHCCFINTALNKNLTSKLTIIESWNCETVPKIRKINHAKLPRLLGADCGCYGGHGNVNTWEVTTLNYQHFFTEWLVDKWIKIYTKKNILARLLKHPILPTQCMVIKSYLTLPSDSKKFTRSSLRGTPCSLTKILLVSSMFLKFRYSILICHDNYIESS